MSDDTIGDNRPFEPEDPGDDEPGGADGKDSLQDVIDDEPRSWWSRRSTPVLLIVTIALGFALIAVAPTLVERLGGGEARAGGQESPGPSASPSPSEASPDTSPEPDHTPSGAGGGGRTANDEKPSADEPSDDDGDRGTDRGTRDGGSGRQDDPDPAPGGGSGDGGNDGPRPQAASGGITSISGGQERVWDPCGLLARSRGDLGGTTMDPDSGNLNSCEMHTGSGDSATTVDLTMWRDPDSPSGDSDAVGSATLYEGSSSDDGNHCEDQIVPAGGNYRFDVEADGHNPCDTADTVARAAAKLIGTGRITTRELPSGSLMRRSACTLPGGDTLRDVLHVDDIPAPDVRFGAWDCYWDGDDDRFLRVIFQHSDPPSDGDKHTYSGHAAYDRGDAWDEGCLVDVVARSGSSPDGDGPVAQLVRIHMTGSEDSESELCDAANSVAKSVAASL